MAMAMTGCQQSTEPPQSPATTSTTKAPSTTKEFKLIPREVLFGNPQKASARISPNGKWLSYLAPVEGILNVWVSPVGDLAAAKPVTGKPFFSDTMAELPE